MMYERFTDRAKMTMQLANQEAQRLNHEYIGTEHMLLGLLKEGSGVAATVLNNLEVDLRKARFQVEKIVQSGPDMATVGKLPMTPRAKTAVNRAMEAARNLSHNYVGTEHLLLGLMREGQLDNYSVAVQALDNLKVHHSAVTAAILEILEQYKTETCDDVPVVTKSTCKTCRWYDHPAEVGTCHRYPPVNTKPASLFPFVSPIDFCGEHKPKDDA